MTKMKMQRLNLGFNQTQVGNGSGLPRWKVSFAERGVPVLSKAEELRICKFLGLRPSEMYEIARRYGHE